MAIVFDPIAGRNVQVADPPMPSTPPPAANVSFSNSPPPAVPDVRPVAVVTAPAPMPTQGSSAAAPAPETNLPSAPPEVYDPTLGSNVDSVV